MMWRGAPAHSAQLRGSGLGGALRLHTRKATSAGASSSSARPVADGSSAGRAARLGTPKRDTSYKLALKEQVEAEFGLGGLHSQPALEDPLLLELYERAEEIEAKSKRLRRVLAARRGIESCFDAVNVQLTRDLDKASVKHLLASAAADIRKLFSVHSVEGKQLVEEHLQHVACETEPIVMGRYLLRMPPMVGGGSIAVPHLFLAQIYSSSIAFGYSLGKAEQQQELEAALATEEGTDEFLNSLAAFLYQNGGRNCKSSSLTIVNESARTVANKQTQRLFGTKDSLLAQVDHIMLFVSSPEEAQESLDQAMRNGTIPWLRLSAMGLRRLMLEAVAFGLFLWDAELLMDVELQSPRQ